MVPRDTIEELGGSFTRTRVGEPTTQGAWGYYVLASAPSGRVIHVIVNQAGVEIASNASSLAVTTGNGPVRLTTTFIVPVGTTMICSGAGAPGRRFLAGAPHGVEVLPVEP